MRKFPHKKIQLDALLSNLAYELCYTPSINSSTPYMRDENDRPILQAAIDAEVDAILTGDKDFHALDIEHPKIISPANMLSLKASTDPFFSESNTDHLQRGIEALDAGKGVEHELIEEDEA